MMNTQLINLEIKVSYLNLLVGTDLLRPFSWLRLSIFFRISILTAVIYMKGIVKLFLSRVKQDGKMTILLLIFLNNMKISVCPIFKQYSESMRKSTVLSGLHTKVHRNYEWYLIFDAYLCLLECCYVCHAECQPFVSVIVNMSLLVALSSDYTYYIMLESALHILC